MRAKVLSVGRAMGNHYEADVDVDGTRVQVHVCTERKERGCTVPYSGYGGTLEQRRAAEVVVEAAVLTGSLVLED